VSVHLKRRRREKKREEGEIEREREKEEEEEEETSRNWSNFESTRAQKEYEGGRSTLPGSKANTRRTPPTSAAVGLPGCRQIAFRVRSGRYSVWSLTRHIRLATGLVFGILVLGLLALLLLVLLGRFLAIHASSPAHASLQFLAGGIRRALRLRVLTGRAHRSVDSMILFGDFHKRGLVVFVVLVVVVFVVVLVFVVLVIVFVLLLLHLVLFVLLLASKTHREVSERVGE
jgi:Flp pilus assembly protein TadB